MDVRLQTTDIFNRTMAAKTRYVVNRGGGGSGKTIAVLQALIVKFLTEENKRILIIRKTLPSLRDSTHTHFLELLDSMGVRSKIKEEKQFLNYYYKNNEIRFRSLDDSSKIKSGEFSYAYLEEATEMLYKDFEMVDMYMRKPSTDGNKNQLFLSFNPISAYHWLKEKVVDKEEDLTEIVSTYKDNPFLPEDTVNKLESLINKDPNLHMVYALGEWGVDSHLIFRNWRQIDLLPLDDIDLICGGMDFGFNVPSAMLKIYQHKKNKMSLYLEECLYKEGLTTKDLKGKLESILGDRDRFLPVYADNAEPDTIKELKQAGFNVKPSKKGKNSVKDSIDFVKRYNLFVLKSSINLIKELQSYSWQVDKDGDPIDKPVDYKDHLAAALRYGVYTGLNKKTYNLKWL